jgi:hypothetical protein
MGRRSRVTGLSLSFFLHTSLTFFSSAKLYITSMSQVMLCTNKAPLALSLNVVALERQKRVEWLACLCHSLHLFFRLLRVTSKQETQLHYEETTPWRGEWRVAGSACFSSTKPCALPKKRGCSVEELFFLLLEM